MTMPSTHPDELLDLVDSNDQIIGQKLRSQVYAQGLSNFRVINAFVVNGKRELWIPRRSANKRIYPLCLDMSVGGHVESGESYDAALMRETQEELNMDASGARLLGHLTPNDHDVSAFMQVYEIRTETIPDYNKNDFVEFFWLTPQQFLERLAGGDKAKSVLPKLIRMFYGASDQNQKVGSRT